MEEFYNFEEKIQYNAVNKDSDGQPTELGSYGGYMYTRSLDLIYYERSVYSVLDLLGDVGGLLAILLGLGDLLVFFFINFTGETLYKYI